MIIAHVINTNVVIYSYSIDERKLKQEAQNKLLQDIETETSNFRADQAMFHKSKMDSINNDIDAMERENKKVMHRTFSYL